MSSECAAQSVAKKASICSPKFFLKNPAKIRSLCVYTLEFLGNLFQPEQIMTAG